MSLKDIETEFDKLVSCIAPIEESNSKRSQVTSFIKNVITSQVQNALIVECGSSALKTYLPEGDLDLILFSRSCQLSSSDEMSYLKRVFNALCDEVVSREDGASAHSDMVIRNVEFINARTKVTHCIVNNVSIDITVDHSSALISLLYLEEIDRDIGMNHLFKRSILLIKVWCAHESLLYCGAPILGAKAGMLSSYAISTLVVHLFNRYDVQLLCSPLAVLRCFLFTYMNFPWETHVLTVAGGVPIVNGSSSSVPSSNGHSAANTVANKFQHVTDRINSVVQSRTSSTSGGSSSTSSSSSTGTAFSLRSCNIQDPMDPSNNLGISVSRANLGCIERALQIGFSHLESLITSVLSASIAATKPPTGYQQMAGNTNKMRSNSMTKVGSGNGAVNGNGKRHSFTNGSSSNGHHPTYGAAGGAGGEAAMDGVNRTFSPSSTAADSVSDDSSGATTLSSQSSQSLVMTSGDSLPPPFPSMTAEVSDSESVAGSVSSFGASSYSSFQQGGPQSGYPNHHYRTVGNGSSNNANVANNRPPVVYQQGDSRYTSPSSSGFAVPPPQRYLPHLSLPQPFMPVMPSPFMMAGGAAVPPLPFVPVTPSNHLHRGGPSPRAPSPSASVAAAPSEPQHVVLRFFPTTLAYYLIDGHSSAALRSDLMEHPLQLNYKHMRSSASAASAPPSSSTASESVVKIVNGAVSDVFRCNADQLWKILKTISSAPTVPFVTQNSTTPTAVNTPLRESPPVIATAAVSVPSSAVKSSSDSGSSRGSPPATELQLQSESKTGTKSKANKIVETPPIKGKSVSPELTVESATKAQSSPSPEAVVEPPVVVVLASPAPVKPVASTPAVAAVGSTKKSKSSSNTSSNVAPSKAAVNGVKNTPVVVAAATVNGNKTKSVPSPSSVAGSDSLISEDSKRKQPSHSDSDPPSSGQSKTLALTLKDARYRLPLVVLVGAVLVYVAYQLLLVYQRKAPDVEAQMCTSNMSDVDLSHLSLSLDDALNSSNSKSKSGQKNRKTSKAGDSSAAGNHTVSNYAVTHWIELNSSLTFGDFSKSGFPNYYAQTLLPSLNSSIAASVAEGVSVSVSYQWTKDNVNLTSARMPYFTVKSAKYSDGGYYRCYMHVTRSRSVNVTSGTTSATATPSITKNKEGASSAAVKSVVEQRVVSTVESHLIAESIVYITKEPRVRDTASYQIVRAGTDFVFTLSVEGSPPPTFQWFKNGYIAEGQTNQSISFPNISAEHIGTYSCKVENFAGGYEWKDITIMVH